MYPDLGLEPETSTLMLDLLLTHSGPHVGTDWHAFYWAVGLLTGIVPADVYPDTPLETAFTIGGMLTGVMMLALVVSSTTSAVSSVDAAAESQRRELDLINGYLRFKRVPKDLVDRINDFYQYLFGSMRSLDSSSAIHSLPPQLNIQLLVAINMRTLSKVPFFKNCDIRAMISVIERMHAAIYCPNEVIVREGAPGKAIYLINQGRVRVLKGDTQVAILVDNDFFGEKSIITDDVTGASVRAVTYCDMSVLLREQFKQARQPKHLHRMSRADTIPICRAGDAALPRAPARDRESSRGSRSHRESSRDGTRRGPLGTEVAQEGCGPLKERALQYVFVPPS